MRVGIILVGPYNRVEGEWELRRATCQQEPTSSEGDQGKLGVKSC